MKKTVSIFITLIASFSTGFAQRSIELIPFNPGMLTDNQLARLTIDEPHTPLATAQRCVTSAYYQDGTRSDSMRHYYTGLRGTYSWQYNLEPRNAHDSFYRYDAASGNFYLGTKIQYDAQDRFVSGQYYSNTAPYALSGTGSAQYNANGVQTFTVSDFDDPNSYKQYNSVLRNDANQTLKDTFYQKVYAGTGDNWITANNYAYDGGNRKIYHSSYYAYNNFTYSNQTITKSFYNGSSPVPYMDSTTLIGIAGTTTTIIRGVYHFYNSNQQLIADTTYDQNGNLNSATSYSYNGNTTIATNRFYGGGSWGLSNRTITKKNNEGAQTHNEYQSWDNASNSWKIYSGDSSTFNSQGYITSLTIYYSNNNGVYLGSKQTVERNNFNNPTVTTYLNYNAQGTLISDRKRFYYYTEYEGGTGIANSAKKLDVAVFPNPAKNKVSIHIKDESQPFNVQLLDLNGKVVLQQSFHKPDATIYLEHLAAGVYQLVLSTTDNSAHFTQKIVKQ